MDSLVTFLYRMTESRAANRAYSLSYRDEIVSVTRHWMLVGGLGAKHSAFLSRHQGETRDPNSHLGRVFTG